jgi:hypothetical protein
MDKTSNKKKDQQQTKQQPKICWLTIGESILGYEPVYANHEREKRAVVTLKSMVMSKTICKTSLALG